MGSPRISVSWAIPSTDNPLIPFGLSRATPRQTGPCCPFGAARSTPVLWGFPVAVPSTVHASPDGLVPGLVEGTVPKTGHRRKLTMQNIVILAGRLGQKPEARTTQGGTNITNFSLATSRPRLSEGRVMRDENGYRVMDTEWHRITCFNGLGKTVAEHCEKGMKVLVHGRIHYTKWTDAAGNDRYGCEIIAEKVDFLSRPKSAESENPELACRDDEIPF
jgi:single-strand DNA-binding protein